MTKEQIKEAFGFELINCVKYNGGFYHYYSLEHVEEMLNKNELAFVYPLLWNDLLKKYS